MAQTAEYGSVSLNALVVVPGASASSFLDAVASRYLKQTLFVLASLLM
jgi:hypothetical protein